MAVSTFFSKSLSDSPGFIHPAAAFLSLPFAYARDTLLSEDAESGFTPLYFFVAHFFLSQHAYDSFKRCKIATSISDTSNFHPNLSRTSWTFVTHVETCAAR